MRAFHKAVSRSSSFVFLVVAASGCSSGASDASRGASAYAAESGHDDPKSGRMELSASSTRAASCTTTPTVVTTNVTMFAAGGGTLAYLKGTDLYVLRASEARPIQIEAGLTPVPSNPTAAALESLAVDDEYVAYANAISIHSPDPTTWEKLVSVDYDTGSFIRIASNMSFGPISLSAHRAFWNAPLDPSDYTSDEKLWTTPADGSRTTTNLGGGYGLVRARDTVGWIGDGGTFWTMKADGSAAPTEHANLSVLPLAFDGANVYANVANGIAAVPIDRGVGGATEIAAWLPPNYPSTGAPSPFGGASAALGPKSLFWVEFWGNGGPDVRINWVLRAAPLDGSAAPRIVDSFTSTGPSTGTVPELASDGVAIYWTHEGTLERLCE